ncbi:diguanylate cyclase (GGDEF)-like protein [Rhizobium sp. BK376]|nr:diguanylate cyclase (GGDEF)-like protein [Rhizobium sp. BK376]
MIGSRDSLALAMRFVHFRLIGPTIAGIALLILGMATFPYYGVARIDAEARHRQEALVERNIALWISDIEFSLTAWTIWDEAIANLDNTFNFEWTDRNIGASLIGTSRTRFAAVLNSSDAILYSRTDDTVKARPFFMRGPAAIVKDASQLVANVRERELTPAKPGIPKPVAISRIEVLGEEAVLLSASLFQPDFGTAKPKGDRAPILITAMPIAGSLQDFFGERFLLDDAHVSPLSSVTSDRARVEIAVGSEGEVEVLSWRPPAPAADVLYQSLPLIVTVSLVLLAGGFFLVRMSQGTAQMLVSRERQMRHAATHDFLTGIANRSLLAEEFKTLSDAGPLMVVCIDLDGFKGVNDSHGHAMGDELLKVVAARLRSGTREEDRLFRLGGDEFAILMPDLSLAEAEQVCRRLSASLSSPIALPRCNIAIGASFGISEVADKDTTCDAALNAADAMLYQAKSLGRGSVVTASNVAASGSEKDVRRSAAARR